MAEILVSIRAEAEVKVAVPLLVMNKLLSKIKEQEQELHNLRTRCEGLQDRLRKNGGA